MHVPVVIPKCCYIETLDLCIFPPGSVPGGGVLTEAGSSAAVSGEKPERKGPEVQMAACREHRPISRHPLSPNPQSSLSPVHIPIHLLYQTCFLNWYQLIIDYYIQHDF